MKIKVELFGTVRQIAGLSEAEFELSEGADLSDLTLVMARAFPRLCGTIIATEGDKLLAPYTFNINGKHSAQDLATKLNAGDSVLLLSTMIGG